MGHCDENVNVIVGGVREVVEMTFGSRLERPINKTTLLPLLSIMPPIPPPPTPRIVIYYQTQHHPDGTVCSILPIITQPEIKVTHVNVAAIHLNDPPGNITLVHLSSTLR